MNLPYKYHSVTAYSQISIEDAFEKALSDLYKWIKEIENLVMIGMQWEKQHRSNASSVSPHFYSVTIDLIYHILEQ
jgi:hypothetical protein